MLKVGLASIVLGVIIWLAVSFLVSGPGVQTAPELQPTQTAAQACRQAPNPTTNPPAPTAAPKPTAPEPSEPFTVRLDTRFVITAHLPRPQPIARPAYQPSVPQRWQRPLPRDRSRYRYGILVREPASDPDYSAMIKQIARRYRVPAGILYGIWKKESSHWTGRGSEKLSKNWLYAHQLLERNGRCVRRYGYAKCSYHYRALRAICSQTRQGRPICDLRRVRVSYAGAIGPMQHMAGVVLWCHKGPCRWARHAVDYDGDGTIDPNHLPEAMAMTAVYLVNRYHNRRCTRYGDNVMRRWKCAVDLYFGIGTDVYFSGNGRKSGVVHHWRRWCHFGHCNS